MSKLEKNAAIFKPAKFKHYFTLAEVAKAVGRHKVRILRLEKAGKIPEASRAQCGEISVRLWSPAQVEEIKRLLATEIRPGRPSNGAS